jgi:hypothetical protein
VVCCCIVRVNICPFQGSRTIRTEEAVLISLARLSPFVSANRNSKVVVEKEIMESTVEFSDESPSDESCTGSSSSDEE